MQPDPIQDLLDKEQIREVLLRYCRGVDRCSEELVRSVYHPDAFDEHGDYRMRGYDFARMIVQEKLKQTEFTIHLITNHYIELKGDVAISEASNFDIQRLKGDTYDQLTVGRYFDRFERRNGEWRIAYRHNVLDWHGSAEFGDWRLPFSPNEFTRGARGEEDLATGSRARLFPPLSKS